MSPTELLLQSEYETTTHHIYTRIHRDVLVNRILWARILNYPSRIFLLFPRWLRVILRVAVYQFQIFNQIILVKS